MVLHKATPVSRSWDGVHPIGRLAWVVRFGACEFETDIQATRYKLGKDLEASLKHRKRSDVMFREEHSADARAALDQVALLGGGSKLSQPGNREALLAYLDERPSGFLVMASAYAAVGRDAMEILETTE